MLYVMPHKPTVSPSTPLDLEAQMKTSARTPAQAEHQLTHKGIDGLAAVCRRVLGDNPLSGAVYVFRNRAGTALKILCYDGQGFWLCTKRLSQGCFRWWRTTQDASACLA